MDNNLTKKTRAQKGIVRNRELEKRMASLSLEEQLTEVLMAPWQRRMELILSSAQARQLVQAMPQQELFWTIKAIGPESSLHILELALPEQLQFFFDLDWWKRDEPSPQRILSWLLVLFELGKGPNLSWIRWITARDQWLIPAILPLFLRVEKRPDDMDIQEAKDTLPAFTLDEIYYIAFRNDKIAPAMAMLLTNLLEAGPEIYRDVMEAMVWNTPSENREKALRLRKSRLNDLGLNDYFDSLDIYAPLTPDEMHETGAAKPLMGKMIQDLPMPAFIPTLYLDAAPLFMQAVQRLQGNQEMARIVYETVGVVNKVIMVDEVDLDDMEAISSTIEKAFGLINLGLESASSSLGLAPEEVLKGRYMEELVRLGYSALRQLRRMARRVLELEPSRFLPEGKRQMLEALTRPTPLHLPEHEEQERPFLSVTQLQEAFRGLIDAELMVRAAKSLTPAPGEWREKILEPLDWTRTNLLSDAEFDLEIALNTAAANCLLDRGLVLAPLSQEDLCSLRAVFARNDADAIRKKQIDLVERFFGEEEGKSVSAPFLEGQALRKQGAGLANRLVSSIKQQVMEGGQKSPDARFISGLLVLTEG